MELVLLTLLILPIVAAIIALCLRSITTLSYFQIVVNFIELLLAGKIIYALSANVELKYSWLYIDELSAVFLIVITLLGFTCALFSADYMKKEYLEKKIRFKDLKRYYAFLNIFCFTMLLVVTVENLGLLWVAVEATTLASALLVAFYFNHQAVEAAWKYIMICTVGICMALLGTIILYYGQLNIDSSEAVALSYLSLKTYAKDLDPSLMKMAFAFLLIGYGTKLGLAPMHTWLPDAHSQAPTPISGLLSGALLSCAFYALMRNIAIVRQAIDFEFIQMLLISFGLLSVLIVVPFVLVQKDIKRLLAYSSVEHMGIVTFALGIGTKLAIYGALLHILNHAVAKSMMFYLAGYISSHYKTKDIAEIRGLISSMPFAASMLLIGTLGMVGMPPFNIFFSKFIIIWASFDSGKWLPGLLLLLLLSGVFAGILYYICQMVFKPSKQEMPKDCMGLGAKLAIGFSSFIIVTTGLYTPIWLKNMLNRAAQIACGG